ncbi:MerR family transcriptional regulator [Croceibacterium ferulae]|uniref:MerR family transcriptional regulator n=1 Tax=Croceibacterium ferulae TaxID=1854641 RepID=UPI000EAB525E|nr:MerR family transcriptional regulator [Croceibacterium ferulae]
MSTPHPFDQDLRTRQQIAEIVGIAPDTVAYWSKEGLLKPRQGHAQGRGKHRMFGKDSIYIAAVLRELSLYGVQTAGLKEVANLVWGAISIAAEFPDISISVLEKAARYRSFQALYEKVTARRSAAIPENDTHKDAEHYKQFQALFFKPDPVISDLVPKLDSKDSIRMRFFGDLMLAGQAGTEYQDDPAQSRRWIFYHVDDQLAAMPESDLDTHDPLSSFIMLDLDQIIQPIASTL